MKTETQPAAGDILAELRTLSEYHAKQVMLWKDMLEQSADRANPYVKRMIAMHEEFGGVLLIVSREISTSRQLEGMAT